MAVHIGRDPFIFDVMTSDTYAFNYKILKWILFYIIRCIHSLTWALHGKFQNLQPAKQIWLLKNRDIIPVPEWKKIL